MIQATCPVSLYETYVLMEHDSELSQQINLQDTRVVAKTLDYMDWHD
jgi:hypothetical protein